MNLYEANVADILRLNQRDEVFLNDVQNQMHSFLKVVGPRNYYKIHKNIPNLANIWYYFMTTLGNLQTLGEEYTATIRIDSNKRIPSKMLQMLWLIIYIGGEPLLDRLLYFSRKKISNSSSLTKDAKIFLLKCIELFKEEKPTLKRMHTSVFYMDGRYNHITNRIIGIRYVLLRQWLQDDTFSRSFHLLGNISLFYIIFNFIIKFFSPSTKVDYKDNIGIIKISKKDCVLCGEELKSPCSTLCGHIFCWNCIQDSLSYQKSCPICRENVNPSRIVFLQNYI